MTGLDEAGRGPLAGPVVACAVCLCPRFSNINTLSQIKDSKKLSAKQREKFFDILTNNPHIKWGTGKVSEKVIDRINIFEAAKLAMKRSVKNLKKNPDFLILDGNFKIDSRLPQRPIVKADGKVFSCIAAGIIAKVTRDRMMKNYHKKFSLYGFDKHKGYPTRYHKKMIKKHGLCKIHRRSFNFS